MALISEPTKHKIRWAMHLTLTFYSISRWNHGRRAASSAQRIQEEHNRRQEAEFEFRRKMDRSRDLEFAQVRDHERRRIDGLSGALGVLARAEFQAESQRLDTERRARREVKQRQRGDFAD